MNLAHTALAEINIADSECFVHEQNLWIDVNRDSESEPDDHAAGVRFHRLIDEITNLRELGDLVEPAVHFLIGEPQDGSVQIDIVAAGKAFRIETGAEFQQSTIRGPGLEVVPEVGSSTAGADLKKEVLLPEPFSPTTQNALASLHFEAYGRGEPQ